MNLRGRKPQKTNLRWLTKEQVRSLTLNVLPRCETVIHKAASNFEFSKFIKEKAMGPNLPGDLSEPEFIIPFISNIDGDTPLHLSIEGDNGEIRVADFFLSELLPRMPLDHHGRAIANIISTCIAKSVPNLGNYLDSRLKTTKQLTKVSRVPNMAVKSNPHEDDKNSFVTCCDLWPDERYVIEKFFAPSQSESETTLEMFDIPYIHNPNMPEANDVATSLVEIGVDPELDLFKSKVIQSIITFRWQLTRKYVLRKLFIPYLIYFATYIFYVTTVFNPTFENTFD